MANMTIPNDVYVSGTLSARLMSLPAGSVTNASVLAAAGIDATKLQHQHQKHFSQEGATAASVEKRVVHVVKGATGTLVSFDVGAVTAAGAASNAVLDLKKNGSSMLTGTVTLDNGTASYALKSGTLASTSLVAGDVLTVEIASVSGASKPSGVFAAVVIREDAQ